MNAKLLLGIIGAVVSIFTQSILYGQNLDTTFNPGSGVDGFVESAAIQSDGKVVICGNFTSVNGVAQNYIARLNTNGTVDTTFQGAASYWVRNVAIQADGKIVIGGFFNAVNGVSRNRIARLNANGSLDTSFDPGTGCDGKIVPVDPTDPFVFAVRIQADGKIVIGGNFTNYNGEARCGVARINSNGSVDTTFTVGSGVNSWVRNILIAPSGKIYLAGWFTSYDNQPHHRMVLLNPNGSPVASFDPFFGDKTAVYSMALQPDGKIVVAGHSVSNNTPFYPEIRRLDLDGSFDPTFNPGGIGADEKVESVVLQPDGKMYIGGYFSNYNGVRRRGLARLNSNGTLDETFNADADNWVWTLVRQRDGKIIACGDFSNIDGVSRNGVARLNHSSSPLQPPPIAVGSMMGHFMDGTNFSGSTLLRDEVGMPLAWRLVGTSDFNNDQKNDLAWQHLDGRMSVWFMDGGHFIGSSPLRTRTAGWKATAVGDLNNDGRGDIVWRHTTGKMAVWLLNGTNVITSQFLRNGLAISTNWQTVAVKDISGDGAADIVLQHTSGQTAVWVMNGVTFTKNVLLRGGYKSPPGWKIVGAGDFSKDGKNDLLWRHTDGRVSVWLMNGLSFSRALGIRRPQPLQWRAEAVTDLDSDGQADLIWRYAK